MSLKAVIFDLNGTVLSDEDEYGRAFKKVLRKLGKKVDSDYPQTAGIGVEEGWSVLLAKYKIKTNKTTEELASETQNEYLKSFKSVRLKKGFEKFIRKLQEAKILTALATSNTWLIVESIFNEFNIEGYFDFVTSKEEVNFNKPAPDIFRITAEKLNVNTLDCLVFEDSASGVQAAKSAGMKVVALARDKKHKKTLISADLVVRNFDDLSLNKVQNLFN